MGKKMELKRMVRRKQNWEPLYSEILKLSKAKQITKAAARHELIRKAAIESKNK